MGPDEPISVPVASPTLDAYGPPPPPKRRLAALKILLALALPALGLIVFIYSALNHQTINSRAAAPGGWPAIDSAYRLPITLTNRDTQQLTNHQVLISIPWQNNMQKDFSDLHITDADKVTELPFWIEKFTSGGTADVWVKLPSLAPGANSMLYAYYGGASTNLSSGPNTFAFFNSMDTLPKGAIANAPNYLTIPTYDPPGNSNGQAVHPSVRYFPNAWHGFTYWMAMTPYTDSNDKVENPSILASNDGINWQVPPGAVNPLVPTPPCGHNNDPELVYNDSTNELWIYYLDTRRSWLCTGQPISGHNFLKVMKSADGITWSQPETVIDWDLSNSPLYLSPSLVKKGNQWLLWVVKINNPGPGVFETQGMTIYFSDNGMAWTNPKPVSMDDNVWHAQTIQIPSGDFWMVSSYPANGGSLRFSTSTGSKWISYTNMLMTPDTAANSWQNGLYRSSMVYDAASDKIKIWYSARTNSGAWRIGYVEDRFTSLLLRLRSVGSWTKQSGNGFITTAADPTTSRNVGRVVQEPGAVSVSFTKSQPLASQLDFEWSMYDDMQNSALKVVRLLSTGKLPLGIGVYTDASKTHYAYHDSKYKYAVSSVPRTLGWHKFAIALTSDKTAYFYIDDVRVGIIGDQFADAAFVNLGGSKDFPTDYLVQNVRVRKIVSVDPSVSFGLIEANTQAPAALPTTIPTAIPTTIQSLTPTPTRRTRAPTIAPRKIFPKSRRTN